MAPSDTTKKKDTLYENHDHPESSSMAANIPPPPPPSNPLPDQDNNPHATNLKLTLFYHPPEQPPPPPPPQNAHPIFVTQPQPPPQAVVIPGPRRQRRNPRQAPREGKPLTIQPPFPWATTHRAVVHTLKHLTDAGVTLISGDVYCKRCNKNYQMEYNLVDKFLEVANYIAENKYKLRERGPPAWMNPTRPDCRLCGQENSVKPVIAKKKKSINWLFLLLGQMIGCCTLDQLKYFCKHTGNHRTAAKNRVVFLTYLELCKQLDPTGPFDRTQG